MTWDHIGNILFRLPDANMNKSETGVDITKLDVIVCVCILYLFKVY